MTSAPHRPTRHREAAESESALADVFALLERLADELCEPVPAGGAAASPEFEATICGLIAHLRARGATDAEIVSRLTRLVERGSDPVRPAHDKTARVAAVAAWCARAPGRRAAAA